MNSSDSSSDLAVDLASDLASAPEGHPSLAAFMSDVRRRLHRRPELAYAEHHTHALVAEQLERFGYAARTVARTGVVVDGPGWRGQGVVLTADMDALPIQEESTADYASTIPGVMHACGHDGHTAALLGAAWALRGRALPFRLVFRPAEEGVGDDPKNRCGAELLLEEGAFEGARAVVGFHIDAARPTGELFIPDGPVMSALHGFRVVIRGVHYHGAYPNEGVDPVWIGTHVLGRLYSLRQWVPSPRQQLALNVISARTTDDPRSPSFTIEGRFRTHEPEVTRGVQAAIAELEALVRALGGTAECTTWEDTPVVDNDPALAGVAREVAAARFGPGVLGRDRVPETGSDDFAFIGATGVPCLYFLMGARLSEESSRHHHPRFDFDEACLAPTAALLCALAERLG
ncbi:MAG: amidohydrolase [Myxococcales bacterium]|nr:amidohydrolase [Myxococcales bacterium]